MRGDRKCITLAGSVNPFTVGSPAIELNAETNNWLGTTQLDGVNMLAETVKEDLFKSAENFRAALKAEGYAVPPATFDPAARTWDLLVTYEQTTLLVMFDLDDPDYVRVVLPFFCELSPDQIDDALKAANEANNWCKGAKVAVMPEHLDMKASIEFLHIGSYEPAQLLRYFSMLRFAAVKFHEILAKTRPVLN